MKSPETLESSEVKLINIRQCARYTGLSHFTVYTLVSQRRIPFVKLGRRTMFNRCEIDKWIAKNSFTPREEKENIS